MDPDSTLPAESASGKPGSSTVLGDANPDSPVPFIFGQRIAQGGMGAILQADDCKIGRKIAVKVMLPEAALDEDQKKRFVQEAAVLGRLEHPNIVPVHDLGRDSEGQLYYSMKLVVGRTLQDIIDDLRKEDSTALAHYTLDRLLTIFRKVCDAMAFSHSEGIVHRDLKPENIMVGEFGEVLVMDWGISKILGDAESIPDPAPGSTEEQLANMDIGATLEGSVMGTPQYMSPEQAAGEVADIDARSDIYSLGAILYAVLTLRPPVEGKNVYEVLDKVQAGDLMAPTQFGKTTGSSATPRETEDVIEAKKIAPLPHMEGGRVPPALSAVVMKALSLKKADRYQKVGALGEDLEKWQGGFATSAEEAGLAKQVALLIRRHKTLFTTATAAWAIITALAVWFVINLQAKEQRALAGEAAAVEERETARLALSDASVALAEASLREGNGPAMRRALERVPENLRDSTWRYLIDEADTSIGQIETGSGSKNITSVAADPTRPGVFAIADARGVIILLNVCTGEQLLEFKPTFLGKKGGGILLDFSPDGERIAAGHLYEGGIVIHRARDGEKLSEWEAPKSAKVKFSPDGEFLMQSTTPVRQLNRIHVWNAKDGGLAWSYPDQDARQVLGVFAPDKRAVVYRLDETAALVEMASGEKVRDLNSLKAGATRLIGLPEDSVLAIGGGGTVKQVSLTDGSLRSQFLINGGHGAYGVTADGKRLVAVQQVTDGRQVIQVWDTERGFLVRSLRGGAGRNGEIAIHPLSGELAVSGMQPRAWDLVGTPQMWHSAGAEKGGFFFGSDDLFLVPFRNRPTLYRIEADSPAAIGELSETAQYKSVTVSADGQIAAAGCGIAGNPVVLLREPGESMRESSRISELNQVRDLRLSTDGSQLAAMHGTRVELWDTATAKQRLVLDADDVIDFIDLDWLNNNQLVGVVTAKEGRGESGSEEQVVLWDANTGEIIKIAVHSSPMECVAIEPGGRRFAEAGVDKMVRIRDAKSLEVIQEFRAHNEPITAIAWHPSRPILATTSEDLSVRLWDLETGTRIDEFYGPIQTPIRLDFSPSGTRLASSGGDHSRIWEPESLAK